MSVRYQVGVCLAVILGAIVCALICGGIMSSAPGFFPLVVLAAAWWAKPLPEFNIDVELAKLLTEA